MCFIIICDYYKYYLKKNMYFFLKQKLYIFIIINKCEINIKMKYLIKKTINVVINF